MIVKIHKFEMGVVVAVCDNVLIGRRFEEKGLVLDLSSDFYKGSERSEEEIISLLKNAYIVNLVGEKAVGAGIKARVVDKERVIRVKGVPHAQGFLG